MNALWMTVLLSTPAVGAPGEQPVVAVTVPQGQGPVGPALVRRIVRTRLAALVQCYRRGAYRRASNRTGRLGIDLRVTRGGQVRSARVKVDTLRSPVTRDCALGTLRRLGFPAAPRASRARVRIDFRVRKRVQASLRMYGWEAGRGIDVGMARRVLRGGHSRFLACFNTHAQRRAGPLAGTVRLRLRVSRRGRAQAVSARGGTLTMPKARRCIERVVRTLRFPRPPRRAVWIGAWLRFRKH